MGPEPTAGPDGIVLPEAPIVPDDKDWTWVLGRPCPECGFVAGEVDVASVAERLRENAQQWTDVLDGEPGAVRRRPDPRTWSALEYACHVRDVCRIYDMRLRLMLTQDDPHYANWDQDVTAVEDDYPSQDPTAVAAELTLAADALAERFDTVSGAQWDRTGVRSDGAAFTVTSFARYFIHDPVHHLWDVRHVQETQEMQVTHDMQDDRAAREASGR